MSAEQNIPVAQPPAAPTTPEPVDVAKPDVAELADRVARLEAYVAEQAVPTFDDVYQSLRDAVSKAQSFEASTTGKVSEQHAAHLAYLREAFERLAAELHECARKTAAEVAAVRATFSIEVARQVAQITAEAIKASPTASHSATHPGAQRQDSRAARR